VVNFSKLTEEQIPLFVRHFLGAIGTHVSRDARLEPITLPGQVYASQAFAALATAQRIEGFTCDYIGQTPLAKKYGTFPTYHVRRLEKSNT